MCLAEKKRISLVDALRPWLTIPFQGEARDSFLFSHACSLLPLHDVVALCSTHLQSVLRARHGFSASAVVTQS